MADYGLAEDLEAASIPDLQEAVEMLPNVIYSLAYNIDNEDVEPEVNNRNRYVVRALSNHLEAASRQLKAKQFPSPLKAAAE